MVIRTSAASPPMVPSNGLPVKLGASTSARHPTLTAT